MLCQDFIDWRAVNRVSPFNIHTHTGRKRTAVLTSLLTALSPSSHRQAFTNHRLRPPRCCYWMEILSFYDGAVTFYFRLLGSAFPALCAAGCHIHRLKIFINQFKSQRSSSGKKKPSHNEFAVQNGDGVRRRTPCEKTIQALIIWACVLEVLCKSLWPWSSGRRAARLQRFQQWHALLTFHLWPWAIQAEPCCPLTPPVPIHPSCHILIPGTTLCPVCFTVQGKEKM